MQYDTRNLILLYIIGLGINTLYNPQDYYLLNLEYL